VCSRILSLGITICGVAIIITGWNLRSKLEGPYQRNLQALSVTINEMDIGVKALQKDTLSFDTYLVTVQAELKQTKGSVNTLNGEVSKLILVAGTDAPKVLTDCALSLKEASKMIKKTSNQAGEIWKDPLADQRKSLYSIAGNLSSTSSTLQSVSTEIGGMTRQIGKATTQSLKSSVIVIEATDKHLGMLRNGSLKQVPATMTALSSQLQTHLHLIESSYDLLRKITLPILLLGIWCILSGIRGMIRPLGIPSSPQTPS